MRQHLLALDITSSLVTFINVVINGQRDIGHIMASGTVSIPSGVVKNGVVLKPAVLGTDLKSTLRQARIRTRDTVLAVQSSRLILRRLNLPPLTLPQLRKMLFWELQRYTPYEPGTAEFDLLSLHLTQKNHTVLMAVAPKDIIDSQITALELAGLRPRLLEPGIVSLFRWIQYRYNPRNNIIMLDLREEFTNILVAIGGQPFVVRTVQITLNQFNGKQRLIEEIVRSIDFVQPNNNDNLSWSCFYTGIAYDNNNLKHYLGQSLRMDVQEVSVRQPPLGINGTLFSSNLGLVLGWGRKGLCRQVSSL
jgi:type IV pilus assembly protein PilM